MPELSVAPVAFVALHRAGRFDHWGAPYNSLSAEERDARKQSRRAQTLWWNGIEWDRSPEEVERFEHEPDGWMRPGLVPFSGDGSGDEYCWYPEWQTGPEPPIVFFVHDDSESRLFAADFAEFLLRGLLRSYAAERDEPGAASSELRALWDAHVGIIAPYLNAEQLGVIDSVSKDFSPLACKRADQQIEQRLGVRTLIGGMEPTDHSRFRGDRKTLLRLYDDSIKYWREIVESEGRTEFQSKLDEVLANRDAAAQSKPKAKAKPNAKAKPKPKAKIKAKPNKAKPKAKIKANPKPKAKTTPKPKAKPKAKTRPKPKAKPKAKAKAKPKKSARR